MPPLSLLYEGFGLFFDILDGRENVDGVSEVDSFKIVRGVDQFADEMCKFYPEEDSRRDIGLARLNKIFLARKNPIHRWTLHAASIGTVRTNGHCIGPHNVASKITVFKNWPTGINTLPDTELISYFAHSQAAAIQSPENKELFAGWRIPCLGITIIGCEVRFYAMLTLGPKFRLVSLTPSISCMKAASDGREREALRTAFIAASVLHACIDHDVNQHITTRPPTIYRNFDSFLPAIPNFPQIRNLEIRDLEPWGKRQTYRYLYQAKSKLQQPILVKFAPHYSADFHQFCADKGYAPKLLAYERLPGGWYCVVIERLEDVEPISMSPHLKMNRVTWGTQLRTLMQSFHDRGFVHGDLRDANILCNAERMWLVDFDWGGKAGYVFYPTSDLHPELLDGRLSDRLAIIRNDDLRVLDITFWKADQNLRAYPY